VCILDALVIVPVAILLGHSLGSQVILEAWRQRSASVQALIPMLGAAGKVFSTFPGGSELLLRRVEIVQQERARLTPAMRERGFELSDSQANFLWAAHAHVRGSELSMRLAQAGVLVAAGAALGEPGRVRIALRDRVASTRLLSALDKAL